MAKICENLGKYTLIFFSNIFDTGHIISNGARYEIAVKHGL